MRIRARIDRQANKLNLEVLLNFAGKCKKPYMLRKLLTYIHYEQKENLLFLFFSSCLNSIEGPFLSKCLSDYALTFKECRLFKQMTLKFLLNSIKSLYSTVLRLLEYKTFCKVLFVTPSAVCQPSKTTTL